MLESAEQTRDESKEARAKRVRELREALRLSRSQLASKGEFSAGTLHGWEIARFTGLTESGARQLAKIFQSEGIDCNPEWLLYGVGSNPLKHFKFTNLITRGSAPSIDYKSMSEDEVIHHELDIFRQRHPNTIDTIMPDDSLSPFIQPGDIIAGERLFGSDISKAVGLACIVQTKSGETLVRVISDRNNDNQYALATTNSDNHKYFELHSAAPIIWMRRKNNVLLK